MDEADRQRRRSSVRRLTGCRAPGLEQEHSVRPGDRGQFPGCLRYRGRVGLKNPDTLVHVHYRISALHARCSSAKALQHDTVRVCGFLRGDQAPWRGLQGSLLPKS